MLSGTQHLLNCFKTTKFVFSFEARCWAAHLPLWWVRLAGLRVHRVVVVRRRRGRLAHGGLLTGPVRRRTARRLVGVHNSTAWSLSFQKHKYPLF